jgi:predicted ester cyclase
MAAIAGWLWPREGPFGGTDAGRGLPQEVSWTILLVLVFLFWAIRRVMKRKAEGEQPAVVEENRRKARRLYEEAFGAGDFSVIDEVVAEGFFDYLGRRHGPEGFKRSVASLRRTFPDLRVLVEEQSAQGNTVTTRCTLRSMDRGGVLWYPPTNRHAAFTATYTDHSSSGMLVERQGGSDLPDLLEQRGLPSRDAWGARAVGGSRSASIGSSQVQ